MNAKILFCFSFLFACMHGSLSAQVIAGEVPPGMNLQNAEIHLSRWQSETDTSAYLDLDQDGSDDFRIKLFKGNLNINSPHTGSIYVLNDQYTICRKSTTPAYVIMCEEGDTLCPAATWDDDSAYGIACLGASFCQIAEFTDTFIPYHDNLTDETGWIKADISLNTFTKDTITFSISDYVSRLSVGTKDQNKSVEEYTIVPNPTADGRFYVQGREDFEKVEIFDLTGQWVRTYDKGDANFMLPMIQGLYVIRIWNKDGKTVVMKVVRQ